MGSAYFTAYRAKYQLLYAVQRGQDGRNEAHSLWLDLDTGEVRRDVIPLPDRFQALEPMVIPGFGWTTPTEAEETLLAMAEVQPQIRRERPTPDGPSLAERLHDYVEAVVARRNGRTVHGVAHPSPPSC